jgi:hypothetical protein
MNTNIVSVLTAELLNLYTFNKDDRTPRGVYEAFYNGLRNKGLNYHTVIRDFKYVGGDCSSHKNYFNLINKKETTIIQPPHANRCICGHHIEENCYIASPDGKIVLVVGNSCIKRFMTHSGRTCEICNEPHKNRKINQCNKCRPTIKSYRGRITYA